MPRGVVRPPRQGISLSISFGYPICQFVGVIGRCFRWIVPSAVSANGTFVTDHVLRTSRDPKTNVPHYSHFLEYVVYR